MLFDGIIKTSMSEFSEGVHALVVRSHVFDFDFGTSRMRLLQTMISGNFFARLLTTCRPRSQYGLADWSLIDSQKFLGRVKYVHANSSLSPHSTSDTSRIRASSSLTRRHHSTKSPAPIAKRVSLTTKPSIFCNFCSVSLSLNTSSETNNFKHSFYFKQFCFILTNIRQNNEYNFSLLLFP